MGDIRHRKVEGVERAAYADLAAAAAGLAPLDLRHETADHALIMLAPGDPQHSYHNILWAGFEELGLRDNYAPQ
jgi:hypothetical protein